jgi:ABC-type transporter Mla maintaining outer membrane lipid asymmetry ATPase subunit MlaF
MHELNQLAKLKKINIPKNWSTTLIVELLALNVSKAELQTLRERTSKKKYESTAVTTIRITNLVKQFGNINAVDGVTLDIREGELFSLLGPNGAGKTTILNILTGILKPTKGTVIIGGYNVSSNLEEIKTKIGVCPQQAAVFNFLSARENMEIYMQFLGRSSKNEWSTFSKYWI